MGAALAVAALAALDGVLLELTEAADMLVVLTQMSRVSTVVATGALVLGEAVERLERRGITVLVSGYAKGTTGHWRRWA